jgi:hypothetical protein
MKTFNYKKAIQSLNLFSILEGGSINYMKAIKLIWLSDRYYLRNHGKTITGDEYFALKNGPLASCTSDLIKVVKISEVELDYRNTFISKNGYSISSIKESDLKVFSKKELEVLNKIYSAFSSMNWSAISDFSHIFPEWKMYESKLKENQNRRYRIDMNLFFDNVVEDSGLFQNSIEEIEEFKDYHSQFYSQYCYV